MPEGHSIHRLALAFDELFGGERLTVSSPQGRFTDGAALLDGQVLARTDAHGKQLFLGFAADDETADLRWLRVHLGLYGAWTFAGDRTFHAPHAIGAPRRRVAEQETALPDGAAAEPGEWTAPEPRGAVRVRLRGQHGVADLTGPTACEVVTTAEKDAVHARLGPDPLRTDHDGRPFVAAVRASRRPVGDLLLDQGVVAGVGNVYRAEALFRARLNPTRPGAGVPVARLRRLWADLRSVMAAGVATGRIVTTLPEHRAGGDEPWYVYRRAGLSCLVCGAQVQQTDLGGRRVFWCPRCQRRR